MPAAPRGAPSATGVPRPVASAPAQHDPLSAISLETLSIGSPAFRLRGRRRLIALPRAMVVCRRAGRTCTRTPHPSIARFGPRVSAVKRLAIGWLWEMPTVFAKQGSAHDTSIRQAADAAGTRRMIHRAEKIRNQKLTFGGQRQRSQHVVIRSTGIRRRLETRANVRCEGPLLAEECPTSCCPRSAAANTPHGFCSWRFRDSAQPADVR